MSNRKDTEQRCRKTYNARRAAIASAMGGCRAGSLPMVLVANDASSVTELYR